MSIVERRAADDMPEAEQAGALEAPAETDGSQDPRSHRGDVADAAVLRIPEATGTAIAGFRRVAAALIVGDACVILLSLLALSLSGEPAAVPSVDFALVLAVAPLIWVGIFHSFGLYGVRHLSAPEEFRRLFGAATIAIVVIMVGSFWWDGGLHRRSLALTWAIALLLELVVRRAARWHVGKGKASGRLALRTVIVGTNREAASIGAAFEPSVRGFQAVGYVAMPDGETVVEGGRILGSLLELPELIRRTAAECVFVVSSAVSSSDVYWVSRCCRRAGIEMRLSAHVGEVLTSRVSVHQVHDLMVLAVRSAQLTRMQAILKRTFDLLFGSLALVATLPLMAAIAVVVKLSSPGPILFRQERVTKDGKVFTLLKFRTMTERPPIGADGAVIDLTRPFFKMAEDPRMTAMGRRLRAWSLDELPQLWNVIRGDMSLVGPRPLAADQVAANLELLDARHEVRAGLTGWWQINGRSDVDATDALKMDLFYIENWSLALDLYVLLKTVGVVLTRKGAY
jgi:exopolysaccharide biosynthesis polyprenyl glycosylphosphotransferase